MGRRVYLRTQTKADIAVRWTRVTLAPSGLRHRLLPHPRRRQPRRPRAPGRGARPPAHTGGSPVSPIIPAHTQNRGGWGRVLNGNVSKICRRADIRREVEPKTRPPRPGRGRRQPRVGHPLTKGAPTAKPASGLQADERPGPNSGRCLRQIRRHCQATAAPCPCVHGIQGG